MAKKTFKQFQNDAKGLTDKQFGKLLDKKGINRPDVLKKIKEARHPRDQKELDRAKAFIKKNPNFGKRDKYGDPIGGPKISKKKLKKNLSTYEGDDKNV
jgi:hypothetical protein